MLLTNQKTINYEIYIKNIQKPLCLFFDFAKILKQITFLLVKKRL